MPDNTCVKTGEGVDACSKSLGLRREMMAVTPKKMIGRTDGGRKKIKISL